MKDEAEMRRFQDRETGERLQESGLHDLRQPLLHTSVKVKEETNSQVALCY